ncbi:MAG: hypothetical protein ACOWW1_09215 [archaeon]|nr:hypothetical protein [Candidatus Bathyarchaeum sp.]
MTNSSPIPEKIVERKIIVYKSRIDQKTIRQTAEKMKADLFRKLYFIKPRPEEVQIISIEKYFEPYVVAEGTYHIEYSKNWVRNIQVDESMVNLKLFGGKLKPVSLKDHLKTASKTVKISGVGRYKLEKKSRIIFDTQWHEVSFEKLPLVPFEDQPEKTLSTIDEKFGITSLQNEKEIEVLKTKLINRPEEITSIHDELFNIFDRAVIYKPMYDVVVENLKNQEKATLTIDAISGDTKSFVHKSLVLTEKESVAKKQGKDLEPKKGFKFPPKIMKKEKNQSKVT